MWRRKAVGRRIESVAKLSGQEGTKESLSMLCSALGGEIFEGGREESKRANEHACNC